MATAKISELVASAPAAAISDADGFELVQGGVTKGGVFSQVRDYVLLGVTRVPGQRYTIDLDSQADSDPGTGLLKFNHATPSSATELYLDDETLDAIDLSVFLATLSSTGWIKIQSALDEDEWIIFRWTALVDSTGYWKFTVVAQAFNGTLDDADEVIIVFDSGAADGPIAAEDVGIADAGTHYTSDNVEGALQEVPGLITAAINALIGGAPGALDTLNELADALADDADFATTVTNALALKAPLASPALTGTPTAPTAAPGTNTTQVATTAFVEAAIPELGSLPDLIIPLAVSDETTALTIGVKSTFRWPQPLTITGVAASLTDAQATGSTFTVDIKVGGVSILSTLITIDNTEEHSGSAGVPPVVSGGSYSYVANSELSIEITQVGDGTAKGLKVYLICEAGNVLVEVTTGTELRGLTFTSDTESTADSDPGAGLMKWNNATQGSATKLFFDNTTLDTVTITSFFAALGSDALLFLQQADDPSRWQLWEIDSFVADSGYYDFSVTLFAKSVADIEDAKTVLCDFKRGGTGGGSTQGLHQLSIPAGAWYADNTDPPTWGKQNGAAGFPSTQTWGFIHTSEKVVYTLVRMPKAWNAGTVTFSVDWRDDGSANAGDVIWSLRAVALGDGDSFTGTGYGTPQTSTDANGTANTMRRSPVSSAITIAGSPAKEDVVVLELRRKVNVAPAVIYAYMLNVTVNFTTDADTDA